MKNSIKREQSKLVCSAEREIFCLKGKKVFVTLMTFALTIAAQGQTDNYTISGDLSPFVGVLVENLNDLDSVILENDANHKAGILQKSAVNGGKFLFTGYVDKPLYSELKIPYFNGEKTDTATMSFILEAGTFSYSKGKMTGMPMNELFCEKRTKIYRLAEEDGDEARKLYVSLIEQHRNDALGIALLLMASPIDLTARTEKDLINSLAADEISDYRVQKRLEHLMALPPADVGDMFIDFSVDYDGKTTHFSDYVGRGQYVLVDFWASWCGPCLQEIPNIITVYEKYKEKGLIVLGVAVSDRPEATLKAINEYQIPYPQIINSQKIATDAYGIRGIPEIILFAPNGTIFARSLRGEDIEKKLSEVFSE